LTSKEKVSISKYICIVLRHKPEIAGITLDANGWADVNDLIDSIRKNKRKFITINNIKEINSTSDKQRFTFNDDYTKIRANHGHSVSVDLELEERKPPAVLYHGTSTKSIKNIMANGIKSMSRLYVHLSSDEEAASKVGKRRGILVILIIDAQLMYNDGFKFYKSANNIWLTKFIPVTYLKQE